jgi:hypothetical protein
MVESKGNDEDILFGRILGFNIKILGLVFGTLVGLSIFIATNWLVIKGGYMAPNGKYILGPHLQLLSQFFIGYKVSFFGSIVGFFYGFAIGTLCGGALGWIYNKIVDIRH